MSLWLIAFESEKTSPDLAARDAVEKLNRSSYLGKFCWLVTFAVPIWIWKVNKYHSQCENSFLRCGCPRENFILWNLRLCLRFLGLRKGKRGSQTQIKKRQIFLHCSNICIRNFLTNFQLNTPIDQPMRVHVSKSWIFYRCDNHEPWLIISLTLWSARSTCRWLLTCIKVGKLLVITCESQWTYLGN